MVKLNKTKYINKCGIPYDIVEEIIKTSGLSKECIDIIIGYYGIYLNNNEDLCYDEIYKNNINISTIAVTVSFGDIKIDLEKIDKYIKLEENSICEIKYKDNKRTLLKKKKKKNEGQKKFYNQLTIILFTGEKYITIMLFKNGTMTLTGCKNKGNIIYCINFLVNLLDKKYIYYKNNCIEKVILVDNINNIYISNIKINNIVSNFRLDFKIRREKLHEKLNEQRKLENEDNSACTFESCRQSGVKVNVPYKEKHTTIIIFHTGSIIIMGARSIDQILNGYNFINKFIQKNKNDLIQMDKNKILLLLAKKKQSLIIE